MDFLLPNGTVFDLDQRQGGKSTRMREWLCEADNRVVVVPYMAMVQNFRNPGQDHDLSNRWMRDKVFTFNQVQKGALRGETVGTEIGIEDFDLAAVFSQWLGTGGWDPIMRVSATADPVKPWLHEH